MCGCVLQKYWNIASPWPSVPNKLGKTHLFDGIHFSSSSPVNQRSRRPTRPFRHIHSPRSRHLFSTSMLLNRMEVAAALEEEEDSSKWPEWWTRWFWTTLVRLPSPRSPRHTTRTTACPVERAPWRRVPWDPRPHPIYRRRLATPNPHRRCALICTGTPPATPWDQRLLTRITVSGIGGILGFEWKNKSTNADAWWNEWWTG